MRISKNFIGDNYDRVEHKSKSFYKCKRCSNKGHNFVNNSCGVCRSRYVVKVEGEKK